MENYSYNNASYPDSGDSSPRSREIDFENPPPWEEQSSQPSNYKVKFMCSFGGNITPRPHDNHLSYVGGETKILSVERNIKFAPFIAKLSALCDTDVCFKYQLPGEDLDALISVTNDDDLEHMMHEYDRLFRGIAKPTRLRLFLFAVNGRTETERPASTELKTDRERFVEALNSGHNSIDGSSPPANIFRGNSNVDYMFNVEKAGVAVVTSPPLHPVVAPVAVVPVQTTQMRDERVVGADPVEIQRRIQELQRMQIGHEQQQSSVYQQQNRAADVINNNGGNGTMNVPTYAGDYYKIPEQKLPVQNLQPGYWQENKQISNSGGLNGNGYNDPLPQPPQQHQQQQQPVYMIPASQGNVYHAPIRAQNPTPTTQGFYAPPQPQQQQQQQLYRDQPSPPQPQQQMYNVVTSQPAPQQPKMVQAYPSPEMVRQNMAESGGGGGGGYTQVAYDSSGRQVYYTAPGGVMPPQQAGYHPQQQQGIAVNPGHEGKVVISKVP